jgi:peroxiredoxin
LREHEDQFARHEVAIVVVTFEHDYFARRYVEETRLAWPLLIDDQREVYRSYGMLAASFWDIWGPASWWAYLKALLKGQHLQKSSGDVFQRGGDVLIDPDGIVRLHHVGSGPADRPPATAIIKLLGTSPTPPVR